MKKEEKERLLELENAEKKRKEQNNARTRRYNQNTVDRISFTVPKGKKADIQKAAEKRGLSVNAFLCAAVLDCVNGILSE